MTFCLFLCVCVCVCVSRPSGIIRTNKDNRVSRSAAATALGCIARSTTALRAGGQVLALLVGTVRPSICAVVCVMEVFVVRLYVYV